MQSRANESRFHYLCLGGAQRFAHNKVSTKMLTACIILLNCYYFQAILIAINCVKWYTMGTQIPNIQIWISFKIRIF